MRDFLCFFFSEKFRFLSILSAFGAGCFFGIGSHFALFFALISLGMYLLYMITLFNRTK